MVFMAARCRWLLVAKREQSSKTFDTFAKFTTLAAPATPLPASDCTILQRKLFMFYAEIMLMLGRTKSALPVDNIRNLFPYLFVLFFRRVGPGLRWVACYSQLYS